MATVTIQGSRNLIYVDLNVLESSYDINNNTSQVSYSIVLRTGSKGWSTSWGSWGQKIYVSYSVAGNSFTTYIPNYNYNGAGGSGTTFASGTVTVGHNADGTASIGFGVSLTDNANGKNSSGTYYTPGNAAWSESSMSLTTIPRASAIGNVSGTIGSAISISWSRASSSFTHTLQWFFGSASGTIGTGLGTSASWTPDASLNSQIPNSPSGTGTIKLITYNGSTYVGEKTATLTLSSPSSVVPSISFSSLTDGNSTVTAKSLGVFVYGKSYPVISATGSGAYGSTINLWRVTINNTTYDKNSLSEINSVLAGIKTLTGSQTVTLSVRDTRGRWSSTASKSYTGVAYSSPTITGDSATRTDSAGTLADNGTYLKGTGTLKMSDLNSKNKMTAKWRYKKKTDSSYTDISIVSSGTSLTVDAAKLSNVLLTSYSYDVILEVSDLFETNTRSYTISSGFDLIHFNASGKAMAIGKKSEIDNTFEIGLGTIVNTWLRPKSIVSYNSRLASSDFAHEYPNSKVSERLDISSSTMTTHKPPSGDGYIKTFMWDNSSAYDLQIAISHTPTALTRLCLRGRSNGSWGDWKSLLDMIYPVGAIYISALSTSPASLFGGTWTQLTGRFLYASTAAQGSSTKTGKDSMSSATGTIVTSTAVNHYHGLGAGYADIAFSWTSSWGNFLRQRTHGGSYTANLRMNSLPTYYGVSESCGESVSLGGTTDTDGLGAHSHSVPYIAVYVWQRTA